jgi:hypothetical protein
MPNRLVLLPFDDRAHGGGETTAVCFSAEADFVSGAVIAGIGVATLAKVDKPRELALGVLPLALGLHQLVEGFVWLGLHDKISQNATDVAIHLYLAFAWVVLPVLVPVGLLLITPDPRRRRIMATCVGVGALVSTYLAWALVNNDISAKIEGHTVQYGGAGGYALLATALYVVATCGPPLLSSQPAIVWFGICNLGAVAVIAFVQADGLTSMWCAWAAVVSVLIFMQFRAWREPELAAAT